MPEEVIFDEYKELEELMLEILEDKYDFEFNTVNSFYMFDNFMGVTLKTAITGTDMQINYYVMITCYYQQNQKQ